MIDLQGIEKTVKIGKEMKPILKEIDLCVHQGEFLAITGPSGSGKSSLMSIIGLLDRATKGKYFLNQTLISDLSEDEMAFHRNHSFGFIFQSFHLLPRLSVLDNILLPLTYRSFPPLDGREKAFILMEKLEIADLALLKPNVLSGGQEQRVAIARALIGEPQIILADEPTGSLDSKTGETIFHILKSLVDLGKTFILITHDKELAQKSDRQIVLKDGKIQ